MHGKLIFETFHVCLKIALLCPCIWLTVWPNTRSQVGNYFPSDLKGIALFLLDFTIAVEKSDTSLLPESLYLTYFFSLLKLLGKIYLIHRLYQMCLRIGFFKKCVVLGTQCTLSIWKWMSFDFGKVFYIIRLSLSPLHFISFLKLYY